jgi:hypothetical protein
MGIVTGYLDQAKDTYANLRKASNDKFGITFKAKLTQDVKLYLATKSDVASVLVTVGEKAVNALASMIPIPHLGTVVSTVVSFAADKVQEELHKAGIKEADQQLATKPGPTPDKLWKTDAEAAAYIQKSMDQYKLIGKYIQTLPTSISTFEDAVTFPAATFKVQQAASQLNVDLYWVKGYLSAMQERLEKIQGVSKEYIARVRSEMPAAVNRVLQAACDEACTKGIDDYIANKVPPNLNRPDLKKPPETAGGATKLAAYVAHATALGYFYGTRDPVFAPDRPARPTRMPWTPPPIPPRSTKVPMGPPPIPARPTNVPTLPPPRPARPTNVPDFDPLLGRPVQKR